MTVTKKFFPLADIHQLVGGLAWPSGLFPGDIIDVVASLGHAGRAVDVYCKDDTAKIRLNVTETVFGRHEPVEQNRPYIPYAEFYTRPIPSGVIEHERTDLVVSGSKTFYSSPINDIKIVDFPSGTTLTFW